MCKQQQNFRTMHKLTSSIPITEVGESPEVSQTDGVGQTGEKEIQFSTPAGPLLDTVTSLDHRVSFIIRFWICGRFPIL